MHMRGITICEFSANSQTGGYPPVCGSTENPQVGSLSIQHMLNPPERLRAYSEGGELAQQIGYPIYEHTIYALVDGYYRPSSTEACHGWRSDERVIIMCTVVIRPLKTSL